MPHVQYQIPDVSKLCTKCILISCDYHIQKCTLNLKSLYYYMLKTYYMHFTDFFSDSHVNNK